MNAKDMMGYEEVLEGNGALRESSARSIPAATEAFRESISPDPGILTNASHRFFTWLVSPSRLVPHHQDTRKLEFHFVQTLAGGGVCPGNEHALCF